MKKPDMLLVGLVVITPTFRAQFLGVVTWKIALGISSKMPLFATIVTDGLFFVTTAWASIIGAGFRLAVP